MPLSSRYSTPGFLNPRFPYLLHVVSVARTFRILVTFVIAFEVRGISFFQYHELSWQKFLWTKRLQPGCSWGVLHSYCDSAVLPPLHGLSERNMLNLFDILIHASTTQKNICSFGLSLFSYFLALVYQLIVKSMRAFVYRCLLLLWSVKQFCPEWLGETNSSASSIFRIGSK